MAGMIQIRDKAYKLHDIFMCGGTQLKLLEIIMFYLVMLKKIDSKGRCFFYYSLYIYV